MAKPYFRQQDSIKMEFCLLFRQVLGIANFNAERASITCFVI